jgi:hypothetical protein
MAAIVSDEDFKMAVSYLVDTGALPVQSVRFIDAHNRKVWDERAGGNVEITPSTPALEAALDSANANLTVESSEATQAQTARNALKSLMTGLHGLSANDKGYALYCRLLAWRDGANNATINAIVDRASAAAYVTAKPEWTNATAATRALLADILEADAALCMVLMLVL